MTKEILDVFLRRKPVNFFINLETDIMVESAYKARYSYCQVVRVCKALEEAKVIEITKWGRVNRITFTKKGKDLLKELKALKELLE